MTFCSETHCIINRKWLITGVEVLYAGNKQFRVHYICFLNELEFSEKFHINFIVVSRKRYGVDFLCVLVMNYG